MNGENDQNGWEGQSPNKPFDVAAELGDSARDAAENAAEAAKGAFDQVTDAAGDAAGAVGTALGAQFGGFAEDSESDRASPGDERLALGDEQSLPWLESADDIDLEDEDGGTGRLIMLALMGLIVLAALIGGVMWATRKGSGPADADGSLIEASKQPYKVAPSDPGGKTFAGTGDSSFKVSDGKKPAATLAGSAAPKPAASPSANAAGGSAAPAAGGVGVQVGAFSSNASAEAAWGKLSGMHEALKGLPHRVIEGKADIGTVYRLQAVAGDAAAANALCQRLTAGGLKCQVKR